ncbi:MAG: hypothetical protein LBM98_13185 [Oscillospiraceae bacterium]|nr:hypothetical protein [Oscillospiraceae bacterium]
MRAAESVRYVGMKPARQSSAGSVTYVIFPPGTGLLRAYTLYVSQVRWRSQRRRTAPGRGQDAGTWAGRGTRPRTARGTTPALRATPPKRGIYGRGSHTHATPVQAHVSDI